MPGTLAELFVLIEAKGGARLKRELAAIRGDVSKTEKSLSRFQRLSRGGFAAGGALALGAAKSGIAAAVIGGTAGTAMAVKGFGDIEQGLAGVRKATGKTIEEFQELKRALLDMGSGSPVPILDLLSISQTAGQLGIGETQGNLSFVRSISKLAATSNLTAEAGATGLAQIINTSSVRDESGEMRRAVVSDIENIASAITKLSQTTTATEADIVSFMQQLSAASRNFGLSADETAALSASLRDAGLASEVSGTAMSLFMQSVTSAVASGGSELEKWAAAADMTTSQFARAVTNKPLEALNSLVNKLASLDKFELNRTLDDLGLSGARTQRVILGLASVSEKFQIALRNASSEMRNATALDREFAAVTDTLWKRLSTLGNTVKVLTHDAVEPFSGSLKSAAEAATGFFEAMKPEVIEAAKDIAIQLNAELAAMAENFGNAGHNANDFAAGLRAIGDAAVFAAKGMRGLTDFGRQIGEAMGNFRFWKNGVDLFKPEIGDNARLANGPGPPNMAPDPLGAQDRAFKQQMDEIMKGVERNIFKAIAGAGEAIKATAQDAGGGFIDAVKKAVEQLKPQFEKIMERERQRAQEQASLAQQIVGEIMGDRLADEGRSEIIGVEQLAERIQSGRNRSDDKTIQQRVKDGLDKIKEQTNLMKQVLDEIKKQGGLSFG